MTRAMVWPWAGPKTSVRNTRMSSVPTSISPPAAGWRRLPKMGGRLHQKKFFWKTSLSTLPICPTER
jgi:hypothetical protein